MVAALALAFLAGCGTDTPTATSTTGAAGVAVSGTVQSPGGALAKRATEKSWFAAIFSVTESYAISVAGFTPVSGATIRAFTIDDDGAPNGPVIATATTNPDGSYNLVLPTGTVFASNLIAQVENDAAIIGPMPVGTPNTLSTPILSATADLNPATNAAFDVLVDRTTESLSNFTPEEVAQYLAMVETLVTEDPPTAITLPTVLAELATDFGSQMTAALDALSGTGAAPLTIVTISPLPNGVTLAAYSKTVVAVGGTGAYTWSVTGGSPLPNGLNLNATTGVISGTPVVPTTFPFSLRVRDAASPTPNQTDKAFSIQVTGDVPASITQQPVSHTVNVGQPATFQATASGFPTPTLQWQRSTDGGTNWTDIGGATSSTFTTLATTLPDNGQRFRMVATNTAQGVLSTATSQVAVLTVNNVSVTLRPITITPGFGSVEQQGGIVRDHTGGISCSYYKQTSADCFELYPHGTSVTLTATPWNGYRFRQWTGDCLSHGTTNPIVVIAQGNMTCQALWEPNTTGTDRATLSIALIGTDVGLVTQVISFNNIYRDGVVYCGPMAIPERCTGEMLPRGQYTLQAFTANGVFAAGNFRWSCTTTHPDGPASAPLVVQRMGEDYLIYEPIEDTACSVEFVRAIP
ncbi:MAG: hypothetical protein HP491_10560 [Nitrospira sp.]|nr:hypothetical protein [Nitrospira sp.]MBH0183737.1 hypothetical protein [Nitrospira sp.]MBH0186863.1 hypothetical protein [Nitrospira sp.]